RFIQGTIIQWGQQSEEVSPSRLRHSNGDTLCIWSKHAVKAHETWEQPRAGDRSADPRPPEDRPRNSTRSQHRRKTPDRGSRRTLHAAAEIRCCTGVGAQTLRESFQKARRMI